MASVPVERLELLATMGAGVRLGLSFLPLFLALLPVPLPPFCRPMPFNGKRSDALQVFELLLSRFPTLAVKRYMLAAPDKRQVLRRVV